MDNSARERLGIESAGQLLVAAATTALAAPNDDRRQAEFRQQAHFAQEQLHEQVVGFIPWIKRLLYITFVGSFLMMSSIGTYGLFYMAVMPPNQALRQLYFDYSGEATSTRPACLPEEATLCMVEKSSDTPQNSPVATVDLFARYTMWEAHVHEVEPTPLTPVRVLKAGHPYFMEISLLMPETEKNRHLGMFTVSVELRSHDTILATSVRSARFPHESNWLGVVRKLVLIFPLLIGALQESRTVVISPFTHFVESQKHPLQFVEVRLAMPQRSSVGAQNVEVVSGEVRIGKELNRFQLVLKHWFFTCYAFGTIIIFGLNVLLYMCLHILWDRRRTELQSEQGGPRMDAFGDLSQDEFERGPDEWEGMTDEEMDDNEWEDMPTQQDHDATKQDQEVGNDQNMTEDNVHVSDTAEGTNDKAGEAERVSGVDVRGSQEDATEEISSNQAAGEPERQVSSFAPREHEEHAHRNA